MASDQAAAVSVSKNNLNLGVVSTDENLTYLYLNYEKATIPWLDLSVGRLCQLCPAETGLF
jgi:hypothetical protein